MTIQAQLADGRTLEFPDGTDPNVIQSTVQRMIQEQQPTQVEESAPEAAEVSGERISGRGIAGKQAQNRRDQAIEELRATNPAQAELIESLSGPEAFLIGAGKGLTDVGRGVGLADDESPEDKASFEALRNARGSAVAGELAGQVAPFLAPGLGVANIASTPLRIAASGALGASEGGILSAGQGGSGEDIAKSAAAGFALGAGGEVLLPVINSVGRKVLKKFGRGAGRRPVNAVTPEGSPTPELVQSLEASGSSVDDLVAASKEIEAGGDIVGNSQREAVFRRLGIDPTEAQRTRDVDLFVDQQDAFRQSGKVRNALDLQETQLTEKISKTVSDVGATADPSSAIDAITDRSLRLDDEINGLYNQAREAAAGGSRVKLSSGIDSLKTNAPLNTRSDGTVKAIRDQMEVMGVAKGFKPTGRINVEQAEDLRQFANSLFDGANPQAKKVIREFKDGLDNDVFRSAGDDVFKAARASKRNFEKGLTKEAKNKFDRNRTSLVRDMLDNTLAPDDAGKIIRAGSKYKAADLEDLKRFLNSGSPEDLARGQAAWNDVRGHAMQFIRDTAFTGPIRTDGSKSLSRAGLEKAFKSIGNDKARVLFNKQERSFLRDLAEVAALKEPPPGTFTGTGPTGLAVKRLQDRIIENSGVPGAGFLKDLLGDFGAKRATKAQEGRVLRLVNDAEKIQRQNERRAFESLRKSQLGGAVRALPFAAIPAIQSEE